MKKFTKIFTVFLLFIVFTPIFGQKYYDEQWKKIEENYKRGVYKSNLPIILEIQNKAMKEDNTIQLIKSLKAEFSIVNQTEDDTQNDATSKFFAKLQTMESKLNGEEKLVYKVLLGEFFSEYYNNESWEINQRTNINNQDFAQIETWSKLDFKNFLSKNYSELEKENAALKQIKMQKYKEIFYNVENLDYFPTLSDWYSVKYIDFLKDNNLFTPNELKVNHNKILELYSDLIRNNSGNPNLYFQHQKLNYSCEFTNCKDKFSQLQNLYNSPTEGDYKVIIVGEMVDQLVQQNKQKEALALIEKAKKQYEKSPFLNNLKNKENGIINPVLSIHFEQHTQSNKPIHIVAEGKNVEKFSLNIYEATDVQSFLNYATDSYSHPFNSVKKTLVRKENFDLKFPNDFKNYKTSLEIKPLKSGIYLVEYVVENSIQRNFYFIASDSRVISNQIFPSRNKVRYALVNRENGKPIASENVEVYQYVHGKNVAKDTEITSEDGGFWLPESADDNYYRYYLLKNSGNNFNLMQRYGNNYYDYPQEKNKLSAQIFLDRAIYRPGQTVYFKIINTKLEGEKEAVSAGISQKITLHDANGEEVSSQTFTTNNFGSYNGSFILPKGKLNGQFSLQIQENGINSYKDFRVEEYKRPKFEVTFEPVKGEYKYGETIEIKGKAMTFSGIPLSNATVNYEIKKHNIRWMYFWWYPRGNDNENSILGNVKTNEKGEFTIKVDLKKDETLDGIQVDNYEVNASVTDINGETQSAETNVKVASVTHYINAETVGNVFADEVTKINVATKNYNDQDLKKSYHAKLSKLQEPNRIFRENFQSKVQDLPQIPKDEFVKKFPHDFYDKNEDLQNWKVEKVVFEKIENQTASNDLKPNQTLDLGKLEAGTYKLELYNIEGKDTIKTEQNFKVWDKKILGKNQNPFLEVLEPKTETKRGEKAKIYVYSAIPDALVNVFVQDGNGTTTVETQKLKNGVLVYEVMMPNDESVTQMNVQFRMVAFNDVQTKSVNLKIADNKKPLRIETSTFRDKIEPNSKEKWSVKILGDEKEKVNPEVLANMYDMSLDQFAVNSYSWQKLLVNRYFVAGYDLASQLTSESFSKRWKYLQNAGVEIPNFNWFDGGIYGGRLMRSYAVGAVMAEAAPASMAKADTVKTQEIEEVVALGYSRTLQKKADTSNSVELNYLNGESTKDDLDKIPVRQNLNETAFFYPNLMTDKDGNVSFEFTSPEALTQWKLMFLAHTQDARAAVLEKTVVTQKEFSVTPNYPRFLREGDKLNLQSKLSSLVNEKLSGTAQLQILDAFTNEDISSKFNLNETQKPFSLAENGNSVVNWKLKVPNDVSSIIIKIVAKAGSFSDGEQKAIAVLPNRMLVTDAVPIFVKEGQSKTFTLENLAKNTSTTATNFANTLELTTNPIWEIMFALPSLKNDQNNSADVVFNKWFADVLASEIFKANPKMKTVFDEYQSKGLLASNLEKNQELKQLLLEETPWVLESKDETEQMQKLARLFDANMMRNSIQNDWAELKKLQNPDGGFSWYQGYPSSYYNSLYILKNLGRINEWLKGNISDYQGIEQKEMVSKLISYVDSEVHKYWDIDKERIWNNYVLDYLDTRHYWENQYPLKGKGATLKNLVIKKAPTAKITDFTFFGLHRAALLFDYYKLTNLSKKLLTYLKETSTNTETQGVYWKQNLNDWGWYSSKTVNHAGALEAFNKLTPNDTNFIEEMKIWLVTQKEVNSWGSSRGTAEVIYTIMNSGKSWASNESDKATIIWGGKELQNTDTKATGYVKSTVKPEAINKNLGTVTVTKPGPGIVQGGLFWQYYEDLDKIKSSESYISITKELYKKIKTENGEELMKITAQTPLKVGDKVTVRMILNTDRNMEFIHLKDMRAAGFEPLNVLSGYEWKNNLGYYQSTKDASTNFYIEYMPKGKYVFEYDYVCNASGTFSNGITTLQNYYAPQMNAHTQGTKVTINE